MIQETYISNEIVSSDEKAQYDEHVRRILKDKDVLSYILKYSVLEFSDYTLEEAKAAIEGEPEVAVRNVRPNAAITIENESNLPGEGRLFFDIVFTVRTREKEKQKLYINIEAQKTFYPGYDLVTRGIVYSARLISQQMDVEFSSTDYDGVKKVYSIWICMNAPIKNKSYQEVANSIVMYNIEPKVLFSDNSSGSIAIGRHDLMSTVFINLHPDKTIQSKNVLIGMLSTLLSDEINPKEKKNLLKNTYNFPMSEALESEVSMCNLSDIIEERGIERGKYQMIFSLIESGDISLEAGAKKLNITVEQLKVKMQEANP